MSMAFEKREAACLEFIRSGFDQEHTIQWMMSEYADDPTIQRTTNPKKLCQNIITIGGTGAHKLRNMAAFHNAFRTFTRELEQKQAATWKATYQSLEHELDLLQAGHNDAENRPAEYREESQELKNLLSRLERHISAHESPTGDASTGANGPA